MSQLTATLIIVGAFVLSLALAFWLVPSNTDARKDRAKVTRSAKGVMDNARLRPIPILPQLALADELQQDAATTNVVEGMALLYLMMSLNVESVANVIKDSDDDTVHRMVDALAVLSATATDGASQVLAYIIDARPALAERMAKSNPNIEVAIRLHRLAKNRQERAAVLSQQQQPSTDNGETTLPMLVAHDDSACALSVVQ